MNKGFSNKTKFGIVFVIIILLILSYFSLIVFGDTTFNITLKTQDSLENGLVGHWTFDGKNMTSNVADSSGSGNTGYLVNFTSTTTVIGRIGQALEFDGNNDYVYVSNNPGLSTGVVTVATWIYWEGDTGRDVILNMHNENDDLWLNVNTSGSDKLNIYFGDLASPGYHNSTDAIERNAWQHVIGLWDGSNVKLYINGVEQASVSTSGSVNIGDNSWTIGRRESSSTYEFHGRIDDTRVYNRALSAIEVKRLYQLGATTKINTTIETNTDFTNGLVGHWTFDGKNMTSNVVDSSGSGNTGYLIDFTSTTTVIGKIGQALDFDGSNDYVDAGDIAVMDTATKLSGSAWVYHDNISSDDLIIGKQEISSGDGFFLFRDDTGGQTGRTDIYAIHILNGEGTEWAWIESATNSSPSQTWTHVAFTVDLGNATGLKLYINGVEDANSPKDVSSIGSINAASDTFKIGERTANDKPFDGSIDDVRVYNRVLGATEVLRLYQQGK